MDADHLLAQLNMIAPLSEKLEIRFRQCLKSETLPRRHLLLESGQISRKIYFINRGFARAFHHEPSGREYTTWFMGEGDLMISVFSFYTQRPAAENIELLEESELLSMTWNQLQSIYADHPEYNYTGRLVTEKYYIMAEERAILLRTLTARERYERLLLSYPGILQKASLGQVASFLGISQETLSRIRNHRPPTNLIAKSA